jgi:hypothetical protein
MSSVAMFANYFATKLDLNKRCTCVTTGDQLQYTFLLGSDEDLPYLKDAFTDEGLIEFANQLNKGEVYINKTNRNTLFFDYWKNISSKFIRSPEYPIVNKKVLING